MTRLAKWRVETVAASVQELHARDVPDVAERTVRTCRPTDVAIVLGRSQDESLLDHAVLNELGISIVRRRSGGGMVLVEPTSMYWFDVVIPSDDALWTDDVGEAFHWLGDAIVHALRGFDVRDAMVHKGAMQNGLFARDVCFLSVGPGEVVDGRRKIVGVSQRRRRSGAVFHCSVLTAPGAQDVSELTVLGAQAKASLTKRLEDSVGWVRNFDAPAFEAALAERLGNL